MGFTEKKAPEQFKFAKIGDKVEGVLAGINRVTVNGKPTVQYTVAKTGNGERVTFLSSADLVQKIEKHDLGCPIFVQWVGERDDVQKNGNKMRTFKVVVDHESKDATYITDEDIPF